MAYFEGEIPTVVSGNGYGNNGGMWGSDGIWAILLLALLGNRGFGFGGGYGGGYQGGYPCNEAFGWQLGRLATTNDVASGFSTSEIMSDLNDIILGQSQGFANVQQTLCQGFNGVNTAILQSANATERGFAQMGYNMANCCCEIKGAIADVKYANERQTCDLITNANANTQRILDYMQAEKINSLTAENVALKGQISNNAQSRYIVDTVIDKLGTKCAVPAYVVPNPNCCYGNYGFNNGCTGIQ